MIEPKGIIRISASIAHSFRIIRQQFIEEPARRYILEGFAYPAKFYNPDYSRQTPPVPTDYRRTLYWNPDLKLDENGEACITFYNNSRQTTLSVEAEGQCPDGTLLWTR